MEPFVSLRTHAAVADDGIELNVTLTNLWCAALGGAATLSGTDGVGKIVDKIVKYSGSEYPRERSTASSLALCLRLKSSDKARVVTPAFECNTASCVHA